MLLTDRPLSEIAAVIAALKGVERSNPSSKKLAVQIVSREAAKLELDLGLIEQTADSLISGTLSPADWLCWVMAATAKKAEAARQAAEAAAAKPAKGRAGKKTKADMLADLLFRPEGATMDELLAMTGWKQCTGFMSTERRRIGADQTRGPRSADDATVVYRWTVKAS